MEFRLPELGENITSADVVKVLVKAGDSVTKDQSVIELETDKAVIELPSPADGVVKVIHVKEGERIKVGQVVMMLEEGKGAKPEEKKEEGKEKTEEKREARVAVIEKREERIEKETMAPALASPMVRRLARELGIDINQVSGTGFKGRVTFDDIKRFVFSGRAGISHPTLPDFSKWGSVEYERMSQVRLKTAETVFQAWNQVPHVTQFDRIDVTELDRLRRQNAPRIKEKGGHLTVTAILVKVIAEALRQLPKFNASVDFEKQEIIYKKYCHIGVAVDTERGLLVPVIRDADKKSLAEVSAELPQMAEKARKRTLTLEEMHGGCMTITNLGGVGGTTYFTPILHLYQVAILGVGQSRIEPIWLNEKWEPRLILPLSLSYDHRVIDGADAARFLRYVGEKIEKIMDKDFT